MTLEVTSVTLDPPTSDNWHFIEQVLKIIVLIALYPVLQYYGSVFSSSERNFVDGIHTTIAYQFRAIANYQGPLTN